MRSVAILFALASTLAWADPSARILDVSRDDSSGQITVRYELTGTDAIITFGGDSTTDGNAWTRMGESAFRRVQGAVNRVVSAADGEERTLVWTPDPADSLACAGGFRARLTLWSPAEPPDFMSAEIDGSKDVRYYVSEDSLPHPITDAYWKMDRILFRKIPAKGVVWNMASISSDRYVRLTHDYYLAVYPYVKAQALNVFALDKTLTDVISHKSDMAYCPQFNASYHYWRGNDPDGRSAQYDISSSSDFTLVLNKIGVSVDFPTEAEWEYAARAGSGGALYAIDGVLGDGESPTGENVRKLAWFADDDGYLHEVGRKQPNAWGLHDMLGGVNEWCLDYYANAGNAYFDAGTRNKPVENPIGPAEAQEFREEAPLRVARGGCFSDGLTEMSRGLGYRFGTRYIIYSSSAFGVRFRAPIPGEQAAMFTNRAKRWTSLDTSLNSAYWDCSGYENPAILEVEGALAGVDCRRCVRAASSGVDPEGVLDSEFYDIGISNAGKLNSRPPSGMSIRIR